MKSDKHVHATMMGPTGDPLQSEDTPAGLHWHPTPIGPSSPSDSGDRGHAHQLPGELGWTGKKLMRGRA